MTAIPYMIGDGLSTAAITTSVITTSVITTTATSSVNHCQTVQSYSCPLTWFADLTATVPKLPTVTALASVKPKQAPIRKTIIKSSHKKKDKMERRPDQTHYSMQTQTPYNLVVCMHCILFKLRPSLKISLVARHLL